MATAGTRPQALLSHRKECIFAVVWCVLSWVSIQLVEWRDLQFSEDENGYYKGSVFLVILVVHVGGTSILVGAYFNVILTVRLLFTFFGYV